jgi:hypothetical protein
VGGLFHVVTKVNNTWIALKDDPIKEDVLYVFNVVFYYIDNVGVFNLMIMPLYLNNYFKALAKGN